MSTASTSSPTVTLLTPLASAALACVRVFGPGSEQLLAGLLIGRDNAQADAIPGQVGNLSYQKRLALVDIIDPENRERIDQAIIRPLPGKLGFELSLHGGVRIAQRTLLACETLGARLLDASRPADRDELWVQSLLLARAAGNARPALWADVELALPRARTRAVADWIVGQWSAGLGNLVQSLLQEPAPKGPPAAERLEPLLHDYPNRQKTLEGIRVAIVGPANAGKSTLFNRLVGVESAIVSDLPGTTRDYVCQWSSLCGVPAELTDTVGLREACGELESAAAAVAAPLVAAADVRVIVLDATNPPSDAEAAIIHRLAELGPHVRLLNKSDHAPAWTPNDAISVSARTGAGVASAVAAIASAALLPDITADQPGLFAERQHRLIHMAIAEPRATGRAMGEIIAGG